MITRLSPHGGGRLIPQGVIVHSMAEYLHRDSVVAALKLANKPIPADLPEAVPAAYWLELRGYSAHLLAAPDGQIIRTRNDDQIAYHAGKPTTGPYAGVSLNSKMLGIEFLVPGTHSYGSFLKAIRHDYITGDQFAAGMNEIIRWFKTHRLSEIERHSHYDPDRKPDPGDGFPWDVLQSDLRRAGVS